MIGAVSKTSPHVTGIASVSLIAWPIAASILLVLLQFSLIFVKSYNWDEFLHYSMVFQLQDGTLARPFQTLLARLLAWVPHVSDDLMTQMTVSRIAVWCAFLVGVSAIYGLAQQFASKTDALWTMLIYFSAGSVFVHGFAIRTDPIAMAALMLSLYMLATRPINAITILSVGAIIGFAGLLTVKAIFYAPCFAGIAWLRFMSAENKRYMAIKLLLIVPAAAATFVGLYLLHRSGLAPPPATQDGAAFMSNGVKWLTEGFIRQPYYTLMAFLTAPLFVFALFISPSVWRNAALSRAQVIALAGLALPLLTILFYRNAFPYFFVFIFAPVAVALAPAIAKLRSLLGSMVLFALLFVVPIGKFITEPREVMADQRTLIEYVNRQFPERVRYLDYSGIVADYPRAIDHLISGIGLANYNARGVPLVAQAVERGDLAFVIANHPAIIDALEGKQMSDQKLLPADAVALHGNYVPVWGSLWLAGEEIPAGTASDLIDIPHRGPYTVDGEISLDGARYGRGDTMFLEKGQHVVAGGRSRRTILWRGTRLPEQSPKTVSNRLFTQF